MLAVEIATMQRVYVVMNLILGFYIQTLGFSTGFANGQYKYTSAVSSASVGLATI